MRSNVVSAVVQLIIIMLMTIVTPIVFVGLNESVRSEYTIMSETRNLVDKIIDTRVLTDDMLADFNLALASQSDMYVCDIVRERSVTNPDPTDIGNFSSPSSSQAGKVYTSYVVTEDNRNYNKGDIVTVSVKLVSKGWISQFARSLLNLDMSTAGITFSGMVR